mmetsp:Transcript_34425/g.70315  ORF Transcript_34425/g.70315 Transcript_34425/m.70315 type:complete len:369 (-) Transcript_34425:451-1557(-)
MIWFPILMFATSCSGWVSTPTLRLTAPSHARSCQVTATPLKKSGTVSTSTATLVRVFELVEKTVEAEGSATLPRAVLAARDALMQPGPFAAALAQRRAFVRDTFGDGDPRAEIMTRRIGKAHAFLKGFVAHERQKASREKVRLILNEAVKESGGAVGGGLDAYLHELGSQGGLDDHLDDFLSGLIVTEARKLGLSPTTEKGDFASVSQGAPAEIPAESLFGILNIVRQRVQVERQSLSPSHSLEGSSEGVPSGESVLNVPLVRMLARAAAITSDDERDTFLRSVLVDRTFARDFVQFTEDGARYLTDQVEKSAVVDLSENDSSAGGDVLSGLNAQSRGLSQDDASRIRQVGRIKLIAIQARTIYQGLM